VNLPVPHPSPDRSPTDRELWAEAVAGAPHAFDEIFDRHSKTVYNHCFRLTGNWSAAEDATATTFLAAWRKRAEVRLAQDSALPWLFTVATNVVRDERRSGRRRLALLDRVHRTLDTPDHADDVAGRLDDERRMAELLAAARRLPRAEREALALCVWSGVSYPDAAAALGIAEASVRRARSRLAAQFRPAVSIRTREEQR
jgi:RNA polymerase sigma factor (sigma-70 family)